MPRRAPRSSPPAPRVLDDAFRRYLRSPILIHSHRGASWGGTLGVQVGDPASYYSKHPTGLFYQDMQRPNPGRVWTAAERAQKRAYNKRGRP